MPHSAYILAGGRSRRFGSDKALATLAGQPLIVRLAGTLRAAGVLVTAVADRPGRYDHLGIDTIADIEPGRGPVGGLHTALHHNAGDWLVLVSCDMVALRPSWLAMLDGARARARASSAVAFRDRGGTRWQPFPGLYHRDLLPLIEAGETRMQRLLDDGRATAVPLPGDWPAVAQANTVDDLAHAARGLARRSEAS